MGSIHDAAPEDDPNVPASNIVGTYVKVGGLYYQGRRQGPVQYAEADEELVRMLTAQQRALIKECGSVVDDIYPDNNAWEVRISP